MIEAIARSTSFRGDFDADDPLRVVQRDQDRSTHEAGGKRGWHLRLEFEIVIAPAAIDRLVAARAWRFAGRSTRGSSSAARSRLACSRTSPRASECRSHAPRCCRAHPATSGESAGGSRINTFRRGRLRRVLLSSGRAIPSAPARRAPSRPCDSRGEPRAREHRCSSPSYAPPSPRSRRDFGPLVETRCRDAWPPRSPRAPWPALDQVLMTSGGSAAAAHRLWREVRSTERMLTGQTNGFESRCASWIRQFIDR